MYRYGRDRHLVSLTEDQSGCPRPGLPGRDLRDLVEATET